MLALDRSLDVQNFSFLQTDENCTDSPASPRGSLREFPARVYAGFVPNAVFYRCRPADVLVYAVVQHLAFHGRKITPKSILAKFATQEILASSNMQELKVRLSHGGIRNALTRLKEAGYIQKNETDWLFLQTDDQFVSANQLHTGSLGYYVRLYHLKDSILTHQDILALSVFENLLTKTKTRYLSVPFISQILNKCETQTSEVIKSLIKKGYISRSRESNNCVYHYTLIGKLTGKGATVNLSTGFDAKNTDFHQNQDSNCHQNRPPISSISGINKSFIDLANEDIEPPSSHRNSFLKKEMQDVVIPYTEKLAKSLPEHQQKLDDELAKKNKEYTQFLKDSRHSNPIEISKKISAISAQLTQLEIKKKKIEHGLNKWIPYTINDNAALAERLVPFSVDEVAKIRDTVSCLSPKITTESSTKMAYCLLLNSLVKDIQDRYRYRYKSQDCGLKAKTDAINQSIFEIKKPGYQLNRAVYPKSTKILHRSAKNEVLNPTYSSD